MAERRVRTSFDASTASFDRGVQRMNRNMRRFERNTGNRLQSIDRRFKRSAQSVQTLQRALAGLAVVAGLRRLQTAVTGAVDKLDEIAKSADKIGLSTEALQELRGAADLSGVSAENLDNALRRFSRTVDDARQGTGEGAKAFERLEDALGRNIDLAQPLDALFSDVADALANVEDTTERAALAGRTFGQRYGVELVNLLAGGSGAIENMRAKMRELGIIIEDDLIRKNVRLKDELTLLQKQLDTDMTEALVRLGPLIRDTGHLFVWLANRAAEAREGWRRVFAGEFFSSARQQMVSGLAEARAELAALDAELQRDLDPATRSAETRVQIEFQRNRAMVQGEEFDEFNAVLDIFAERREGLVERVETLQQRLGSALEGEDLVTPPEAPEAPEAPSLPGGGGAAAAAETEERANALERELKTLKERTAELRRMTQAQALLNPEMENYETALRAAEIESQLITAAERENIEVTKKLGAKIREVARAYAEAEGAADGLRGGQDELNESASRFDDIGRQVLGSFIRDIRAGTDATDALNSALSRIVERLIEIQLNSIFDSDSGGGGGNFLSDLFRSIFSSGSSTQTISAAPHLGIGGSFPVAHRGGEIGRDIFPQRQLPAATFLGAPRFHNGLLPNEFPAILEKGEVVVPKNIGIGRGGNNVTINEGNVSITQPGATPEQIRRIVAEERQKTIRQIVEMNEDDPETLHT